MHKSPSGNTLVLDAMTAHKTRGTHGRRASWEEEKKRKGNQGSAACSRFRRTGFPSSTSQCRIPCISSIPRIIVIAALFTPKSSVFRWELQIVVIRRVFEPQCVTRNTGWGFREPLYE